MKRLALLLTGGLGAYLLVGLLAAGFGDPIEVVNDTEAMAVLGGCTYSNERLQPGSSYLIRGPNKACAIHREHLGVYSGCLAFTEDNFRDGRAYISAMDGNTEAKSCGKADEYFQHTAWGKLAELLPF
jgi:hypothetical protein